MNCSVAGCIFRLCAVFIIIALVFPAAYATVKFGGPAALPAAASSVDPLQLESIDPLAGPGPILAATTSNLFAQVAFGGGYTTVFSFTNTGATEVTASLYLTDSDGQALITSFSSPGNPDVVDSVYPLDLPSGGFQEVIAQPISAGDPTKTGWARVESTGGTLGGVATFQFAPGGTLSTIVGVLSAPAVSAATIPVDDDHVGGRDTGYAIANPGTTDINVKLIFVHPDGTIHMSLTPPALNPLHPGGHVATFLWQDAADQFLLFRGTVVMIEPTGKAFSVVALVLNNGLFTAVPVIQGSAPTIR